MRGVWDGENVGKKRKYVRDGENQRKRRINDEMKTRLNIRKIALILVLECGTIMQANKNYKKNDPQPNVVSQP
jgi:hypothetical protein